MIPQTFLAIAVITLYFSPVYCLFNSTPTYNYTVPSYNSDLQIILEQTGTKFMIVSLFPTRYQIYSINGTKICEYTPGKDLWEVIWPANHSPIFSTKTGTIMYNSQEDPCKPIVEMNLTMITKKDKQRARYMSFFRKDNRSVLTFSGLYAVYQIDLQSSQLINSFSLGNWTFNYYSTLYSKDMSYLYALAQNKTIGYDSRLDVWENTNPSKPPVKQINLSLDSVYGPFSNSKESNSGILVLYDQLQFKTNAYTFDASGVLTTKITRTIGEAVIINDGNIFDAVAICDNATNSLEIVKIDNGQSLQNLSLPQTHKFQDGYYQYKNRVMVLLNITGSVLVYSYENDIAPNPPNPDDDNDSGSTTWIVISCVLVAALVIGGAVFFYMRKKRLTQKNSGIYGKLNDQV